MKVAYITTYDAGDMTKWSGLGHYIFRCLKNQGVALSQIGPLKEKYSSVLSAKEHVYHLLLKKKYLRQREGFVLKDYARQVAKRLSGVGADIVFSPSTIPISYLECKQPIVFWTDATFAGMIDFYPEFSNLCTQSIKNGNAMEKAALERSSLAIYSSEWAARTAVDIYKANPAKVKVVPFGANINCDRGFSDIERIVDSRPSDKCKLLFLGVDWDRKGGSIALELAKKLNNAGLETELTVVGCQPSIRGELPVYVRALGFISKTTGQGLKQIDRLFAESHFLILPSRTEAFGVVFCEANSFGVPCIATDVGGIPTIIRGGINGKLFPIDADIEEYCTYILDLFSNYDRYKELALSSFKEYQYRLNWSVSGKQVKKLLESILPT